ncbi:DUF2914 domain-containing protein [candidate division KSB1 bacterium]|nr:DUF2914 domain-containing protein [candidate division KSB1 bacterium]
MFKNVFRFRLVWILEILFVVVGLIVVVLFQQGKRIETETISDDDKPAINEIKPQQETVSAKEVEPIPVIEKAVMCQDVDGGTPVLIKNRFNVMVSRVYCFVSFEPSQSVRQQIYHHWIYKNTILYEQDFVIGPSQKQTWSYFEMSPNYRGEWQVKIIDQKARVLQVLEFVLE